MDNLEFRKRDLLASFFVFYCIATFSIGVLLGIESAIVEGTWELAVIGPVFTLMFGIVSIPLLFFIYFVLCLVLRALKIFNRQTYILFGLLGSVLAWHYLAMFPWYLYLASAFIASYISYEVILVLSIDKNKHQ